MGAIALSPMQAVHTTMAITISVTRRQRSASAPNGMPPTTPTSTMAAAERAEGGVADAELGLDAVEGLRQREPLALLERRACRRARRRGRRRTWSVARPPASMRTLLVVRELDVDRGLAHDGVVLVAQLDLHGDEVLALALDALVDDLAGEEGGVAGEGGVAVLGAGVGDRRPTRRPRRRRSRGSTRPSTRRSRSRGACRRAGPSGAGGGRGTGRSRRRR